MKSVVIMQKLMIALVAAVVFGLSLPAVAQSAEGQPAWMPKPPKAIGGKCDADPKWMRKWHMKVLDHKRDETVHEGIRTAKFSLKRCISCHAVKEDSGKFLTVKDERHFCRSCHDYAAVRIDCFDCHASRPGEGMDKAAKAGKNPHKETSAMSVLTRNRQEPSLAALQKYIAGENK